MYRDKKFIPEEQKPAKIKQQKKDNQKIILYALTPKKVK